MIRVVVTGVGVVSPIGSGTSFWDGLASGRSGAARITNYDPSDQPVQIACEVRDFDATDYMERRDVARSDRFVHMAVAAGALAAEEASFVPDLYPGERVGVIVGSAIGGLSTIENQRDAFLASGPRRVDPFMIPRLMPNAAAAAVAMKFGAHGVCHGVTSACATGAHAIGDAFRSIQAGAADVIFAGGTEAALTPLSMAAFARMGALSRRNDDPEGASRPFDKGRDGFVFAEGAAVLVLESKDAAEARGAPVLAELVGYGASCDAFHVTQPDPEARGAVTAISAALREAGGSPQDVDYINAHGTSTPYNDRIETLAISKSLGNEAKRIPVSSTKSQTGHLLGAAGAIEAAATVLMMRKGIVPATINLDEHDPDCDLDYVADGPRDVDIELALSNSFGFGGQNACLAFRRAG